jgi:hypothetical protein
LSLNLPHIEPLLFAKSILSKDNDEATVLCEFEEKPNLSTFVEAAAQSCSALNDDPNVTIAFLASVKNIKLVESIEDLGYHIDVKANARINNIGQFEFKVKDLKGKIIAIGEITIVIPN